VRRGGAAQALTSMSDQWVFSLRKPMKIGWRIHCAAFCRDVCAHSRMRSNGAHTCRQKTPARMRHPCELTEITFSNLRRPLERP